MVKLEKKAPSFSFWGIIVIVMVFAFVSAILFVELYGVQANRYTNRIDLLPKENAITKTDALSKLKKDTLFIWDGNDGASSDAYEQFCVMLDDMKVSRQEIDVSKQSIPDFYNYERVIVLLADLTPMGTKLLDLCQYVYDGNHAWFPMTLEDNVYFSAIASYIGVDQIGPTYHATEKIYLYDGFMIGGGRAIELTDPFESSRVFVLAKNTTTYATAEHEGGLPLVWTAQYGKGHFVLDNIGIYDKVMRGFYSASYSLMDPVCAYPVINASTFYLDDFPSQIPGGTNEYIQKDYGTTTRDFYINIWWPDMMNFSDKYGLKYTGLAIQSYDSSTDGSTEKLNDTGVFTNFGNMLLRKGGELGYHGYNHQPLCLDDQHYKESALGYSYWASLDAMHEAFDELVDLCDNLFPDTPFTVYVPPSNILSREGKDFLMSEYKHIRTISGIYFEDAMFEDEDCTCLQEYEVLENGVVDQPRVISGCILDTFQNVAAISELNMHFVNNHFTHPDDALDPERGATLGWAELTKRFDSFLSWLYSSAPGLRNLTGSETSAAVQRFVAAAPEMTYTGNNYNITIDNFYDNVYFLVRFNEKQPVSTDGGTLTHITGNLYLLEATESVVDISLK